MALLGAAVLGSAAFMSQFWVFIPLGVGLLYNWHEAWGFVLSLLCLAFVLLFNAQSEQAIQAFDYLGLVFLFVGGMGLYSIGTKPQ